MKFFVPVLLLFVSLNLAQAQQPRSQDDQVHVQPKNLPQPKQEEPQLKDESGKRGESTSQDSQKGNGEPAKISTDDGVQEMRPYDPHKAAKDVEVGRYYMKHKNYRAALDRLNEALLYKPNDAEATFYLAETQEKLEMYDRAYRGYRAYLTIIPEGPLAKESQQGLKRLEPRLQNNQPAGQPADVKQIMHEGETALAQNDFEAAHVSFVKALQITPDDPVANFRVAQSLQGLQRLDEARFFYKKCLTLQPDSKMAADAKRQIADINFILGK